jgi:hypothetical protein
VDGIIEDCNPSITANPKACHDLVQPVAIHVT